MRRLWLLVIFLGGYAGRGSAVPLWELDSIADRLWIDQQARRQRRSTPAPSTGDYTSRNLTCSHKTYFVSDSNDLFMISFTPETSVSYSLAPLPRYRLAILRTSLKIVGAHRFLYRYAPMDWLLRQQFRSPVRLCGGNSPEWRWRETEIKATNIIARIEHGGNLIDGRSMAPGGPFAWCTETATRSGADSLKCCKATVWRGGERSGAPGR